MFATQLAMADLDAETASAAPPSRDAELPVRVRQRHQRHWRQPRNRRQRRHDQLAGKRTGDAVPRLGHTCRDPDQAAGVLLWRTRRSPATPTPEHTRAMSTRDRRPERPSHRAPTGRDGGGRWACSSWGRSRARACVTRPTWSAGSTTRWCSSPSCSTWSSCTSSHRAPPPRSPTRQRGVRPDAHRRGPRAPGHHPAASRSGLVAARRVATSRCGRRGPGRCWR